MTQARDPKRVPSQSKLCKQSGCISLWGGGTDVDSYWLDKRLLPRQGPLHLNKAHTTQAKDLLLTQAHELMGSLTHCGDAQNESKKQNVIQVFHPIQSVKSTNKVILRYTHTKSSPVLQRWRR